MCCWDEGTKSTRTPHTLSFTECGGVSYDECSFFSTVMDLLANSVMPNGFIYWFYDDEWISAINTDTESG